MEAAIARIESGICFRGIKGGESRGKLLHLTAQEVVFEVYSPYPIADVGDVLPVVRIFRGGEALYSGEATVRASLATGMTLILTASLPHCAIALNGQAKEERLGTDAREFVSRWGNVRPLHPEYQIAVSDIRAFLTEMSQWLAPLDLADQVSHESSAEMREGIALAVHDAVAPRLAELFGRFEKAFHCVAPEDAAAHRAHAQRELHPLVLCTPLMHRGYLKPMGYAGDYGTINIILENKIDGPSTYARVLNAFFTRIDICQGHRNRIDRLTEMLRKEVRRPDLKNDRLKVLNLGCGPVDEICRFIAADDLADLCDFTLLDFSAETIEYAREKVEAVCRQTNRWPRVEFVTQSIHDLLREAVRNGRSAIEGKYDLAYCAGLFDYMSDRVCARLMDLLCDSVTAGGRVVATNVHSGYRNHAILEELAEWHLILRDESGMQKLAPRRAGVITIDTEAAGVNLFLDVRKKKVLNDFVHHPVQRRIAHQGVPGI